MSSTRLGLTLTTLCLVGRFFEPGVSAQATLRPGDTRVIMVREQEGRLSPLTTALDLIRNRFPVQALPGRFASPDGVSDLCVTTQRLRQHETRASSSATPGDLPRCETIATYVDGLRIIDASRYLSTTNARDIESIELLTPMDAQGQLGMSAGRNEVLVLWSKGRGPHVRGRN
ncbi:MAG: hypothetical protein ACRENP_09375 [Longimicrobiales bacterium]